MLKNFFADISVTTFSELLTNGAGGILLLVPGAEQGKKLTEEQRDGIMSLEDHLLTTEMQVPVYFAEETEETRELLETLESASTASGEKVSGAQGEEGGKTLFRF